MNSPQPLRIGIGGPVGSGKTALTLALCRALRDRYNIAVVTTTSTRKRTRISGAQRGVDAGAYHRCRNGRVPAHRESARMPRSTSRPLHGSIAGFPISISSSSNRGGDNLAATFSPELSDLTLYIIDVAAGDKIPRKGGPGITKSDLLVINKIDLAPMVGASLEVMERDARRCAASGRLYSPTSRPVRGWMTSSSSLRLRDYCARSRSSNTT